MNCNNYIVLLERQQNEMESTDRLEGDEEGIQQVSLWTRKQRDFER